MAKLQCCFKRLTALVIYTGKKVPKNRNFFEMSFYGTFLRYVFNVYVIAEQKEEDLIKNKNIFALIILAIKYVIDSPNDYAKRFGFKKKLLELGVILIQCTNFLPCLIPSTFC